MKHGVFGVTLWDFVVAVDNGQLSRVLEWVSVKAEGVEEAPQGPNVS